MNDLTITLPTLHSSQARIQREARRFNALSCGRRFGKTTLLQEQAIDPALEGYPVGWFAPTYKLLLEAWDELAFRLVPITKRSNASDHRIELITGGQIDFWTLKDSNAGRSRKYRRVIIDEAGQVVNLVQLWHAAIRPTLADYAGDAWLAGTPKGRNGFWELWELGGRDKEWAHWQMPTDANPFIPRDEIAAMRASMPALVVAQEVDAEFTEGELTLFRTADIERADGHKAPAEGENYLTSVDVGRRHDATVINTFEVTSFPYKRVAFERLERIPYPKIQERIAARAQRYPGQVVVESNGIGDPVIENLDVHVTPFVTTARSKMQALQALQLLFEQGNIQATWDARERAALIGCSWDDQHTADEVMSLAIFASVASSSAVSWLVA